MRTVSEIYKEYKIMPGLQMHMLRVAAVAKIICDNFEDSIDADIIIKAALFHDMANIIKSDLSRFPEFLGSQGLEYWQKVKDEYITKYGADEIAASALIMRELGMEERAVEICGENTFSRLCEHAGSDKMDLKIVHYADGRVDPYGVKSYKDRMEEARVRYYEQNKNWEDERAKLVNCGLEMEKQIFARCKIKPEDITDEVVAPIIEELKNFVIK